MPHVPISDRALNTSDERGPHLLQVPPVRRERKRGDRLAAEVGRMRIVAARDVGGARSALMRTLAITGVVIYVLAAVIGTLWAGYELVALIREIWR
jgi:hypothetical protein